MPSTQVSSRSFVLTYSADEMSQGDARIPVCYVQYPEENASGITFLPTDVSEGFLGSISLKTDLSAPNFVLEGSNAGQNSSVLSPVNNNLSLRVKTTPTGGGGNFDPCILDKDGNGIVSTQDIDNLYEGIPFVNPALDIDGNGIVDEADYLLAREYVGEICNPEDYDPQGYYPVLHLDCQSYTPGSEVWEDLSGNDYHFSYSTSSVPPVQNPDGSFKVGYFYNDESGTEIGHGWFRQGHEYENLSLPPAERVLRFREKYIPFTDTPFSWEVVFRMSEFESNALDIQGEFGPPETNYLSYSHPASATWLGYALYQDGGWHFGTFLDGGSLSNLNQYAFFPYQLDASGNPTGIVPYRGYHMRYFSNAGWGQYSSSVSTGQGGFGNVETDYLGLDFFGFRSPFAEDLCVVQYVNDPYSNTSKLYVNGVLKHTDVGGISMNIENRPFKIGLSTGGGVNLIKGVDVYMFKAYDEYLPEDVILNNYNHYITKYP